MRYFSSSSHEQQHVKIKIKKTTKLKCLPGEQIRSCGNTAKKVLFQCITLNSKTFRRPVFDAHLLILKNWTVIEPHSIPN